MRGGGARRSPESSRPASAATLLLIEVDGAVAGAIAYEEVTDPGYHSAGIDLFLGAAWQGRGLGREAIETLVRYLIEERGHHRLTIDPAAANERAIRCYEAVGFERVGIMRQYERTDGGPWHDGLLLELLADDVARALASPGTATRSQTMVGVFVTFHYDDGVDAEAVTRIAQGAAERFRGLPGLRSKAFTVDRGGRRCHELLCLGRRGRCARVLRRRPEGARDGPVRRVAEHPLRADRGARRQRALTRRS